MSNADRTPGERLDAFLGVLERAAVEEIQLLAVRPLDPGTHDAARQAALEAARFAGRAKLVEDGRAAVVHWVERSMGSPTYLEFLAGPRAPSISMLPEDRVLLARTLQDAVLACIVRDRVDEAIADELIGPCTALVEGTAGPQQGPA